MPDLVPQGSLTGFKKTSPVVVNGDHVEYLNDQKKIEATGNVSVTYGDVKLTCDRITVFTDTKIGKCEGNVKVVQVDKTFTGQSIEYNFEQKTGKILDGTLSATPISGRAQEVDKVSDKEVILREGYVTTCDDDHPHYRIRCREVEFYINDKIVAKHVFFYVGNTPVFYMPYFVQPLQDPKTKITVVPGYTGDWGYYALTAYRYYLNEQCKGYLRLDYRTKKGLGEGIDYNYNLEKLGEGNARYYYTHENDALVLNPEGQVRDRYRFQYKHLLDFDERTQGTMEINKMSDSDMIKDYFFTELEDGWTPDNYLSIINHNDNYSFQVFARKRFDDFVSTVERMPEMNLQVYNQKLWDTPLYYENTMSFSNLNKEYATLDNTEHEEALRFHTYNKVSYVTKLFKFLYTTPYAATRQTYYSENRFGDNNLLREIYEYGIDFSSKFYRIFDTDSKSLNLNKLRHVITPTVGFHHRHQPSISPSNLHQFDEVDALDYENLIALGLENKLQTRRPTGDDTFESYDLVRLLISTNYLYRLKKGNLESKGDGRLSDITYDLEVNPYDWISAKTTIVEYVKDYNFSRSIKHATSDLVCTLGETCDFGIGHIYDDTTGDQASQFTTEVNYKFNKDWSFRIYERFDAHKNTWQEQEYTIYKDFHCWLGELSFNIGDGFAVWMVFRLKAFPDTPIGFKRTYRRPAIGSTER
ncbi:MAG: LptA/OstA family protein [Candidatus Omnitrophica bacterium]|nr:LptA/OstA family protein [Candidatus Omnitrophota bacterium]